jgi:hypothetical protein
VGFFMPLSSVWFGQRINGVSQAQVANSAKSIDVELRKKLIQVYWGEGWINTSHVHP